MNGMAKCGVAAALFAMTSGIAMAQNLEEREKINRDKVQLTQYANRVNQACGTHIQFSINYASYQGKANPSVRMMSPTEYLMNAGDAMINICKTDAGKQAVKAKITEVHGAYTEGEEESLAGGVFTYKTGWTGGSIDHPEKFLKTHL